MPHNPNGSIGVWTINHPSEGPVLKGVAGSLKSTFQRSTSTNDQRLLVFSVHECLCKDLESSFQQSVAHLQILQDQSVKGRASQVRVWHAPGVSMETRLCRPIFFHDSWLSICFVCRFGFSVRRIVQLRWAVGWDFLPRQAQKCVIVLVSCCGICSLQSWATLKAWHVPPDVTDGLLNISWNHSKTAYPLR